jgi:FKBP-type peptidyl-prolyl cis-trans isomerase FklB
MRHLIMTKTTKTLATLCAFGFLAAASVTVAQDTAAPAPATGTTAPKSTAAQGTTKSSTQSGTSTAKTGTGTATHRTTVPIVLTTDKQKASYALGQSMARSLQRGGIAPEDVDTLVIARGIRDALSSAKPALTDDQQKAALTALAASMKPKIEAKNKEAEAKNKMAADANQKAGDAFLAANKSKDGVTTLPSGLQYKVITTGTGPKPTAQDTVTANYRGTLIDGKEFDASAKHGGPTSFPVSGVIKGWTEALQLMPVGSKWQLFIPPDLAYGGRGAGPDIGPNSTLVFDVELVSIKPAAASPNAKSEPGTPKQ